ncbi:MULTISPECIES: DUF3515 domain-containing protein [unclassified Rhodococcus (in: high G+C Gram-positive bacteria)]|uniref:DUF3515 domain-containing protein n=1 Tax=unclassified Rhodococcus (in: high G+C Gram-positive bacteria) TaxID=192944 RepID=UPI0009EBAA9E|nr:MULTISPECIES: DUF3515 domain-containing protein [unclassified Rhodococcus (in: high G+C Gram-positive bacteria)]
MTQDQPSVTDESATGLHPALVATAIALPVALVVGVLVAAVMANSTPVREPVAVGAVPAPLSESTQCADLLGALPDSFDTFSRAEMVQPAPPGAAAWQSDETTEPIVLRCGLDRPLEFDQAARLDVVDGVQWFQISGADQGLTASTWYVVDRAVYAAATIPDGTGPTPIQALSAAVTAALPQTPLDPAPVK